MAKKWEIRRVSTSERIFNKIKEEMAQPVGIILFGADCDFKNEVIEEMIKSLPSLAFIPASTSMKAMQDYNCNVVTVMLSSKESAAHGIRHELVKTMRNAGAKTVVGIYAKAAKAEIKQGKLPISSYWEVQLNQQIAVIEQNYPTAEGLDYFIVVKEDKEK